MRDLLHPVVLSFVLVWISAPDVGAQIMAMPAAAGNTNQGQIEPPRIIFGPEPAVLIRIDGDPIYQPVKGTELQRIVNTKPLVVRDELGGHFLRILDGWMEAYALEDSWSIAGVPPKGSSIALRQAVASKDVDLLDSGKGRTRDETDRLINERMPAIYVSMTPAVLVVTGGTPRFVPVAGTALEFMENATARVFREPTDHELYILLSGRWFRSWTTVGPWQYIPSDQLPADFAKIPASLLK